MRTTLTLAVALAAAIHLVPGTATAVGDSRKVASSSHYCVYEASLIRETDKHDGYGRGTVRSYKSDCGTAVNRDVSFLAQSLRVWFSDTATSTQRVCRYTNTYYNTKTAWAYSLWLEFPDRPYCGAGWYEIEGAGHLWWDDGWRGGRVWSGRQFLNI